MSVSPKIVIGLTDVDRFVILFALSCDLILRRRRSLTIMSFRTGLLPHLLRASHLPTAPSKRLFHFLPSQPSIPRQSPFHRPPALQALARTHPPPLRSNTRLYTTVGLGLTLLYSISPSRSLQCATTTTTASSPYPQVGAGNPPPESILSFYELSFGAVCGICTGVFIKKGLRAIAFLLGGVFVFLQVSWTILPYYRFYHPDPDNQGIASLFCDMCSTCLRETSSLWIGGNSREGTIRCLGRRRRKGMSKLRLLVESGHGLLIS